MSDDGIERLIRVHKVTRRFISRAKHEHVAILMLLVRLKEATVVDIARAAEITPEAGRRYLDKLCKGTRPNQPHGKLVEKCRFDDRVGLFHRLTALGRLAVDEIAAAFEEPEESFEWSPCDGEGEEMMDDWMATRSLVRG